MSQMYQQYERQRVDNIPDPAVRRTHPISTISGVSSDMEAIQRDRENRPSTVKITEIEDDQEGQDNDNEAVKASDDKTSEGSTSNSAEGASCQVAESEEVMVNGDVKVMSFVFCLFPMK